MAPIGEPIPARGPDAPWSRVSRELQQHGAVVVYGLLPEWRAVAEGERLRGLLGQDWTRYERMRPGLRDRFAASRLILRYCAAAVIDTTPELVDLAYHPGGRPYVRGCDQIDISLSHTGDLLVVGTTRLGRIGVDVERADRSMAGTGSELQACTPDERRLLARAQAHERNGLLIRLWTLKEAYSKALGQGLRFRFTEFGFLLRGTGAELANPDGSPAGSSTEWSFGTFGVENRYVVSTALYDAGWGGTADLSVETALDEGLLDTLLGIGGRREDGPVGEQGQHALRDPAGLRGGPDGVDPVAGAQLADDGGEVVPDGPL